MAKTDTTNATEVIWFQDPQGFIDPEHLLRFFPVRTMTLPEQLNAIMRFSVYFTIILLIAGRSTSVLFIPLAAAAGTYIMYQSAAENARVMREGLLAPVAKCSDANRAKKDRRQCTRPTADNPFMNVLQSDYVLNPQRGGACDIQRKPVARKAESLFDSSGSGLIRDSDDVFHRRASSRQFVTNPATTIPNDQQGFAEWLYGKPPVCKIASRSQCPYRT